MPLEPQGTAISGASKAPKNQFYVAVYNRTDLDVRGYLPALTLTEAAVINKRDRAHALYFDGGRERMPLRDHARFGERRSIPVREGERAETGATPKTGEPRFLARLYPAKERLKGAIQPPQRVLLAGVVAGFLLGIVDTDGSQFARLIVVGNRHACHAVGGPTVVERAVIEKSVGIRLRQQCALLGARRA